MEKRDIGWAITSIKKGLAVQRPEWGTHTYIALRPADADSAPGITVGSATHRTLWLPTASDLFADDWQLHDESDDYGPPLGARQVCDGEVCDSCQ